MKLQDPKEVTIDGTKFFIRPLPAFKAANISGEVIKVLAPIIGSLLPLLSSEDDVMDVEIQEAAPVLAHGFESFSGDACESLLRKLLINYKNVAVEIDGERDAKLLDEDLSNEIFCGDAQNMYVLAFHVIKVNYSGFFGKLGTQSGGVKDLVQKMKSSMAS